MWSFLRYCVFRLDLTKHPDGSLDLHLDCSGWLVLVLCLFVAFLAYQLLRNLGLDNLRQLLLRLLS